MSKVSSRRAGAVVCAALSVAAIAAGCWSVSRDAPEPVAVKTEGTDPVGSVYGLPAPEPTSPLVSRDQEEASEGDGQGFAPAEPAPSPAYRPEGGRPLRSRPRRVERGSALPAPRFGAGGSSAGLVGTGRGGSGPLGGGAAPLPQSGVLANNFVGGAGVQARLDDLLDRGVMIDGQQVRIEAFQDRARLPYAVPGSEAVALHTELERSKVSAAGDTVHLQIALLAKQGEAPPRPRLDVRLVIDRSGSMQEEGKWPNAIAAAHALVDRLQPGDTFGLISYSDDATLDVAPTALRAPAAVHRAIDRLAPGGGTNIGAALALARQHRPARRGASDVAMVILLSDGLATVGVTDPRAIAEEARAMFDEGGVLTTSIGVGTSFDEDTMLSIAREGSGSYHFVRRAQDISTILADELDQRVQAVAQGLRVRVVLGGGVVAKRVYGSRLLDEAEHAAVRATEVATDTRIARELGITRDRQREAEDGLRIHLPTFRRGDQHVILMELSVPGGRAGSTAGIARVFLDYKDLGRRENATAEALVLAERTASDDDAMASVQRTVKRTVLSFQAGDALQQAASALSAEDMTAASQLLAERRELLEAAAELWRDPTLRRDAALLGRYETVVARAWPSFRHEDRRTLVMAMSYFGDRRMR